LPAIFRSTKPALDPSSGEAFLLARFPLGMAALEWTTIRTGSAADTAQGRADMANREQRKNKEKKKPKADKNKKNVPQQSAFSAQAPGMGKQSPQQPNKK
jgi:hypothetical protein